MFTGILAFLKGKIFSQAGGFLLPIFGLLAIFLIWNSDTIMTKFGFETTTNLKSEVTRLKGEVINLEEKNKKLTEDIERITKSAGVTVDVVEDVATVKSNTKDTVTDIINNRKEKAKELLNSSIACACEDDKVETKATVVKPSTELKDKSTTSTAKVEKPKKKTISQDVVDRLSADNIEALNLAYAQFFPESGK